MLGTQNNLLGSLPPAPTAVCFTCIVPGCNFAIALSNIGTAYAVGNNAYGQLGDGTVTNRCTWVPVCCGYCYKEIVNQGSAELTQTYGIKCDGTAVAWGSNYYGFMGIGESGFDKCLMTPVCVDSLSFKCVVAGCEFVVALDQNGKAYSFGCNANGQLGLGDTVNRFSGWYPVCCNYCYCEIVAACNSVLAIKTDGCAVAWGSNADGKLGDGTTTGRCQPVAVCCNYCYIKIASATSSAFGIKSDNKMVSWGNNTNGRLGDGTTTHRCQPVAVCCNYDYCEVASGGFSNYGIKTDGCMVAWGDSTYGTVGDGVKTARCQPVAVCCNYTYSKVRSCNAVTLAIKTDGCMVGWGYGAFGAIGDAASTDRCQPVAVCCNYTYNDVSIGSNSVLAIKTDGCAVAWGGAACGALGIGAFSSCDRPTPVCCNYTYCKVAVGCNYSYAIKCDGTVVATGLNSANQLNDGTLIKNQPVALCCNYTYTKIIPNNYCSTVGIKTDGCAVAWGMNCTSGQLGDGTVTNRCQPVAVCCNYTYNKIIGGMCSFIGIKTDGTAVAWGPGTGDGTINSRCQPVAVCCNYTYCDIVTTKCNVVGIKTDGTAVAWGDNNSGVLGDGTIAARCQPVAVCCNYTYCKIIGENNRCFFIGIKTDGTAVAWGDGVCGILGNGATTARCQPVAVCCNYTYSDIKTGCLSVIGIKTDGCAVAWGDNLCGQLGDNTTTKRCQPVAVCCNYTYNKIIVDYYSSCISTYGIKTDSTVVVWGRNNCGQLGDNSTTNRCQPVATCSPF